MLELEQHARIADAKGPGYRAVVSKLADLPQSGIKLRQRVHRPLGLCNHCHAAWRQQTRHEQRVVDPPHHDSNVARPRASESYARFVQSPLFIDQNVKKIDQAAPLPGVGKRFSRQNRQA